MYGGEGNCKTKPTAYFNKYFLRGSFATFQHLRRGSPGPLAVREFQDSTFRQAFTNRHVVLPVIHVESSEQAHRNSRLAREAGADGVFLINHAIADEELLAIHDDVAGAHPGWWTGVNCLGLVPEQVFR